MSKQAPTTAPTSLDEVLFIMTHLIGLEATVTLKDDKVITGLVHAFNPSMPLSICLVNATLNNSLFSSISILQQDVVSIHVNNVSFYNFKTDKDISSSTPLSNRALEKWVDDGSVTTTDLDSNPQKWDQFKANESLFGVTTDYNDNIYTTTIDTSGDFKKRELDAQRLANEILKV